MARPENPPPKGRPHARSARGRSFTDRVAAHPLRWAVIAYALLTVIFFAGSILAPGKMIFGSDTMSSGVFFRTFYAEFWRDHFRPPLWNPFIHAGLPFVDAMHGDIFYPAALLQVLLPVTYAIGLKLILHIFLAGVFMFMFLRAVGRTGVAAFIGGLLYMFSPCLVSLFFPGHDGKIYVTALTPLAFLTVYRGVTARRFSWFFGFGLVYTLMILTAHVQMAYYAAWGLGLYFLFLLWDQHRFSPRRVVMPILALALAVVLAGGAAAIQWMAPYQYIAKHSQRLQHSEGSGFEWSSSWSMHSQEAFSQLNPEFPGANLSAGQTTYWGENVFKLNSEAVGVMAFVLALVALIVAPSPPLWFFAGLSILILLHALGASTPVFRLFYEFVPMVKKFRAPSMSIFLAAFAWVVMAAWAIEVLLAGAKGRTVGHGDRQGRAARGGHDPLRVLTIVAIAYSAVAVIGLLMGESFMTAWSSIFGGGGAADRMQAAAANAGPMRLGFVVGALVLWALVAIFRWHRRGTLAMAGTVGSLGIVAVLPLWQFDARFVQRVDPGQSYGERPILNLIRRSAPAPPERYRVLLLPRTLEDNYLALHGIEELSASAMHGNHLLLHDNFVGRHDPQPALITSAATRNLLNAMLIVSPQAIQQPGLSPVGQSQNLFVLRNKDALPRAAVFYQYDIEADSGATLARLRSPDSPYRSRLILDQAVSGFPPSPPDEAPVPFTPARIIAWQVDEFTVECTAERDGLLWLSENYYPAWTATDESGRTLPIYRADYAFRAVPVTEGPHEITFRFHNPVFNNSVLLSLVCLVILIGGAVWTSRFPRSSSS